MKTYKNWLLLRDPLTEADIKCITGNSCKVEAKRELHDFENLISYSTKMPLQVAGRLTIKITTDSDAQEIILKLKYGDELVLVTVIHSTTIPL